MGLESVIRGAVKTANKVTGSLQVSVTHESFKSIDEYKKPTYEIPPVTRTGLLEYSTKMIRDNEGNLKQSLANLTFVENITVTTKDRITLPDGTQPPILRIDGMADPKGGTYLVQVYFG